MDNTILDYIASHFKEALRSGCITVCYEPVLRALTGKICAFEALARWHDPEYGDIAPHDFIPVLEAHDKVHLLDYFVTKVTMQNLYHDGGFSSMGMSLRAMNQYAKDLTPYEDENGKIIYG